MLKTLHLILPVLVPSWRFFKSVEPSPRVQWASQPPGDETPPIWQDFRPRPPHVTALQMLGRLVWNAAWNDQLFVVSCAERIALNPTDHSIKQIKQRLFDDLSLVACDAPDQLIRFQLVFVQRSDAGPISEVLFVSDAFPARRGDA